MKLAKFFSILATVAFFIGFTTPAAAETFQTPLGAKITWVDDGKGNAIVSWSGMSLDTIKHFVGHGDAAGRVVTIKVPADKKEAVLADYAKNGLRFNGMLNGRWVYLGCPADSGNFASTGSPTLENGLMINCDYIGPTGHAWGAIQLPKK